MGAREAQEVVQANEVAEDIQDDARGNMVNIWGEESDDSDYSLVTSFQFMGVNEKFSRSGGCHDTDILLNTGLTMIIFNKPKMLLNIFQNFSEVFYFKPRVTVVSGHGRYEKA